MWTRNALFVSACVCVACDSATSPAPADDDDVEQLLQQIGTGLVDPGPRGGAPGVGGPFAGLSNDEKTFFNSAREVFSEVDSVSGTIEEGSGLGPSFNGNSCAQCHAEPAVGGSSPHPSLGQLRVVNPQVGLAKLDRAVGKNQTVPAFITPD